MNSFSHSNFTCATVIAYRTVITLKSLNSHKPSIRFLVAQLARLMQLFDEFAHGWAGFGRFF